MAKPCAKVAQESSLSSYGERLPLSDGSSIATPYEGPNVVRREFKPALWRAGLPTIRFHDLRHTFASLLIAQGAHPKLISGQLGHASVKITLDRYGHLMDLSYGVASDRIESALFGTVTQLERAAR